MRNRILFGIVIICGFQLHAQQFSPNRETFAEEFQQALNQYGKGDFSEFAKKELPAALIDGTIFSDGAFKKVVETCNSLSAKKVAAYPSIYNYVFSAYSLLKRDSDEQKFTDWQSIVNSLISRSNLKKYDDFIELSAHFFKESVIAHEVNFNWYYEGGEYSFVSKDNDVKINFKNGNLICRIVNKKSDSQKEIPYLDSIHVANTVGSYDPFLQKWNGNGGLVTWEKVGLTKAETQAVLSHYHMSLKTPTISADSVLLTTKYFATPILGNLSDRASTMVREADRIYPQFKSYSNNLRIKDILPEIDYQGEFTLQGINILGVGTTSSPATIKIYREDRPFINVSSKEIIIRPNKISVNDAKIFIKLHENDSIYHSSSVFTYDLVKQSVEIERLNQGNGLAPFYDSYHKVYAYYPKIVWKRGDLNLLFTYDIGTSDEQHVGRFESENYFDRLVYDQIRGLDPIHPLLAIYNHFSQENQYVISEGKFASILNKTIEQAKPILLDLARKGFIFFDFENKQVIINQKLINFVLNNQGDLDYDNLVFETDLRPKDLSKYTKDQIDNDPYLSLANKQNVYKKSLSYFAKLDLSDLRITLNSVDAIKLSEVENVSVFPDNTPVVLDKNRNFYFSGSINAGKMELNVLKASYDYNGNKLNLLTSSQSLFRISPLKQEHGNKPIAMKSSIQGIKGEILISDSTNRSGLINKAIDFPKINVFNPTKVYYNSLETQHGAYDTTRFYYALLPFSMDSLDNFNEKSFTLNGHLVSSGIFPEIKYNLSVMPDYSFGFICTTPQTGYPLYKTSANYFNKIVLSNNGLQGSGNIEFNQATAQSVIFTFVPDSTFGIAKLSNKPVESDIELPDIEVEKTKITFIPAKKHLKAETYKDYNIRFFDSNVSLKGTTYLDESGVTGNGTLSFKNAQLNSTNFRFYRWRIGADNSCFTIANVHAGDKEDSVIFNVSEVKSMVDIKRKIGQFSSVKNQVRAILPVHKYVCDITNFVWKMDKEKVEMKRLLNGDVNVDSITNFISTHPNKDSLQFSSNAAILNLNNRIIDCEHVPYVIVADAKIIPDSSKLVILKNAEIGRLNHATIQASIHSKYHLFSDASVSLEKRNLYYGEGNYLFRRKDNASINIKMNSITVDNDLKTIAKGEIKDTQYIKLSDQFDFYGNVTAKSEIKFLIFDGYTRINHQCEKYPKSWMKIYSPIDPLNIEIPYNTSCVSQSGEKIVSGMVWRNATVSDSVWLYPAFLSNAATPKDSVLMSFSGNIKYVDSTKRFEIGTIQKLANYSNKGDIIFLETDGCVLKGIGKINLGIHYPDLTIDAYGHYYYDSETDETIFNLVTKMRLPVDKSIISEIAGKINEMEGLKPIDFKNSNFTKALFEWTDQQTVNQLVSDFLENGSVKKLPSKVESTLTISDLHLIHKGQSSKHKNGLLTLDQSAVIIGLNSFPVLKYLPFRAYFEHANQLSKTDRFTLMLGLPHGKDYYVDCSFLNNEDDLRVILGDNQLNAVVYSYNKDKLKNVSKKVSSNSVSLFKFWSLFK
jgi:hypothetical protein